LNPLENLYSFPGYASKGKQTENIFWVRNDPHFREHENPAWSWIVKVNPTTLKPEGKVYILPVPSEDVTYITATPKHLYAIGTRDTKDSPSKRELYKYDIETRKLIQTWSFPSTLEDASDMVLDPYNDNILYVMNNLTAKRAKIYKVDMSIAKEEAKKESTPEIKEIRCMNDNLPSHALGGLCLVNDCLLTCDAESKCLYAIPINPDSPEAYYRLEWPDLPYSYNTDRACSNLMLVVDRDQIVLLDRETDRIYIKHLVH
jgi:hypothetical protein